MKNIQEKKVKMREHQGNILPYNSGKIGKNREHSLTATYIYIGCAQWVVTQESETYVVDLRAGSCICRQWELSGIPCKHTCDVIIADKKNPEEFVYLFPLKGAYFSNYSNMIFPLPNSRQWPQTIKGEVFLQTIIHYLEHHPKLEERDLMSLSILIRSQDTRFIAPNANNLGIILGSVKANI